MTGAPASMNPFVLTPSLKAISNSPPGQSRCVGIDELDAALAGVRRLDADRDDVPLDLLARDRAREQDVGLHVLVVVDGGLDLLLALAAARALGELEGPELVVGEDPAVAPAVM